jgi:hypothetical protein
LPPGRQVFIAVDAEPLARGGREEHRAIKKLNVDRMVGRGGDDLRFAGTPGLGELLRRPAAGDDDPAARVRERGGADAVERLRDRLSADPAHLMGVVHARADRMNMRIDQAGNDGAAAEVDDARARPGVGAHLLRAAGRRDSAVAYRQRLDGGERCVLGRDAPVQEHGVGGLRAERRDAGGATNQQRECRTSDERRAYGDKKIRGHPSHDRIGTLASTQSCPDRAEKRSGSLECRN